MLVEVSMNKESERVDETFERFVVENYKRVFNYIFMIANDYELAKDMTQDAFLRAAQGYAGLRKKERIEVWMFRIAHNVAINRLRREHMRRSKFVSLFTRRYEGELIDSVRDPKETMDETAARREEQALVRRALYELPARMREALILREWETLSYEEIGRIMRISKKAVKSLLHRARETIREKLLKEDAFR
jgi:RNA polymerase sigma-70 factor (ECF subfamily)